LEDGRTLESYGAIVTLVMVVVPTPAEIEARSREVWNATKAGDGVWLAAAIEKGGDLDWRNPDRYREGWTACHAAIVYGNAGCLAQLLRAGADVNQPGDDGRTPVFMATDYDREDCLRMLIKAGGDVDKVNNYGWSPCYVAAWWGNDALLALLIEAGADFNRANDNGGTPLDRARSQEHDACVALLQAAVEAATKAP